MYGTRKASARGMVLAYFTEPSVNQASVANRTSSDTTRESWAGKSKNPCSFAICFEFALKIYLVQMNLNFQNIYAIHFLTYRVNYIYLHHSQASLERLNAVRFPISHTDYL
jgi:hypothetical protein